MKLISPAFSNYQPLPIRYTCDGLDLSPPLQLVDVPPSTQSLVLIFDTYIESGQEWIHWLVWNIPPSSSLIKEGRLPAGSIVGINDFGHTSYTGPCSDIQSNLYQFQVHALNVNLELPPDISKAELLGAPGNHITESAALFCTYQPG